MEVKYFLYGDEVKKNSQVIGTKKAVKMEIMDQRDKVWQDAEVMIFEGETKGAEAVGLLGPFGEPYGSGKYFVKIVKILPSVLADE